MTDAEWKFENLWEFEKKYKKIWKILERCTLLKKKKDNEKPQIYIYFVKQ